MRSQCPTAIRATILLLALLSGAQAETAERVDVTAHLETVHQAHQRKDQHDHPPPAVAWLKPLHAEITDDSAVPHGRYTLLQKNKTFSPHLLIVPVGSVVYFPNRDPFFHNVFSLFDGKRFDLGLYEAGSTREVTFSREGVSYIFCNIHPQMSAVVLALTTPFYATADEKGIFHLRDVPAGEYELHVWVEGEQQSSLDHLTKTVKVSSRNEDLGALQLETAPQPTGEHLNEFGQPYRTDERSTY